MHQIEALCDRVAVIHQGRRVVYGDIDTVRRERSRPAVFVRTRGALPELLGVHAIHPRDGGFELLLDEGIDPPDVLEALIASQVRVERFEEILVTMEQVFLQVARGEGTWAKRERASLEEPS